MSSNDTRLVKTIEVDANESERYSDPIYFMEKQANRGAYGLMMPETDTRNRIARELVKAGECRHAGERFEKAGKSLAKVLELPHFTVLL